MARPVIEPVRRSFAILEALSRRPHGTILELTAETGLPRPTVVRLLQTLIELGYVLRISRQLGYRLTDRVLGLAQGIRFIDQLVDAAAPHMRRFTRQHGWPLYLGTISHRGITIRHSTAPESPLSFERIALQRRSPILTGALGRAWLAFSPDEVRRVDPARSRRAPRCGACHGLRAHPPRRPCLHRAAALGQAPGHRRADPQARRACWAASPCASPARR